MKKKQIKLGIDEQVAKLEAIAVDLSETWIAKDAEWQADRVRQVAKDLKDLSTQIHGGGTGEN